MSRVNNKSCWEVLLVDLLHIMAMMGKLMRIQAPPTRRPVPASACVPCAPPIGMVHQHWEKHKQNTGSL